jgi:hypothetical protein
MITYELRPQSPDYLLGESVWMDCRIVNREPRSVTLPDPAAANREVIFAISGPQYPDGQMFSHSGCIGPSDLLPPASDPQTIQLGPGETWEKSFPVRLLAGIREPGTYRFGSRIVWHDLKVTSTIVEIRFERLSPVAWHAGQGAPGSGGEILVVHRGAGFQCLYHGSFQETRADVGDLEIEALGSPIPVGPDAAEAMCPARDCPYFAEMYRWFVWREGFELRAIATVSAAPRSLLLDRAPAFLVRPPLQPRGCAVEVLAVYAEGPRMQMLQIGGSLTATGKAMWDSRLPALPKSAAAALATPEQGGHRHVAFAVERDNGIDIFHTRYGPGAPPEAFQTCRLDRAQLLADGTPAIAIAANGSARVACLVLPEAEHGDTGIAEACFPPAGAGPGPGPVAVTLLGPLPAQPQSASITWVGSPHREPVAAVVLPDRRVYWTVAKRWQPKIDPGEPDLPPLILPGEQFTYLVQLGSDGQVVAG